MNHLMLWSYRLEKDIAMYVQPVAGKQLLEATPSYFWTLISLMPLDPYFTSSYRAKDKLTPEVIEFQKKMEALPHKEQARIVQDMQARASQGERFPLPEWTFIHHFHFKEHVRTTRSRIGRRQYRGRIESRSPIKVQSGFSTL